jgi:hypothetical protein
MHPNAPGCPKCPGKPPNTPRGFVLPNRLLRGHSGALGGVWGRVERQRDGVWKRRCTRMNADENSASPFICVHLRFQLLFFFLFAIFAFFASHFSSARKARPLSLPSRCAFGATKAQRAWAKPSPCVGNAVFILQNRIFSSRRRCAFVKTNAQRAIYERPAAPAHFARGVRSRYLLAS